MGAFLLIVVVFFVFHRHRFPFFVSSYIESTDIDLTTLGILAL